MKNRIRQTLRRELRNVRVSDALKMRILAEAAGERFREEKRRSPVGWLAATAAMILVVGITAGMLSLRTVQTRSHTLAKGDGAWVWVSDGDALYHARKNCGGQEGMERVELEAAKAQGRTACRECITVQTTQKPEEGQSDAAIAVENTPAVAETAAPETTPAVEDAFVPENTPAVEKRIVTEHEAEIPVAEDVPIALPEEVTPIAGASDANEEELPMNEVLPTEAPVNGAVVEANAMGADDGETFDKMAAWTVYMDASGEYYHLEEDCPRAQKTKSVPLEEIAATDLTACPECVGEGTVETLHLEMEQFGPWTRCRAYMPTNVEWIAGQGDASMDSDAAQRILFSLCPTYMSQEQADEFITLLNEGQIKGFRCTLCMLSVEDSDLWKTQTQFYANKGGVRETTLLLEAGKPAPESVGLKYVIMKPEYLFEEDGVVDNTSACSIRTLQTQGKGDHIDALALSSVTGESNQELHTLSAKDSGSYTEEIVETAPDLRKLEIDGEMYLMTDDNYACKDTEDLRNVIEDGRQLVSDLFGVSDAQVEAGHSWTASPEYTLYPAYRIRTDVFTKKVSMEQTPETYYATYGGLYYHKVRNCSDMRGAMEITEEDFDAWNKKPCPVCLNSLPVWVNPKGHTYHRASVCSGQSLSLEISVNEAEKQDYEPCPDCFSELYDGWIERVMTSGFSVEASAGDGALAAQIASQIGVEWIYAEKGEYGWSKNKQVQQYLSDLSPSMMTEEEAEDFRRQLERGEVVGFRCVQCNVEDVKLFDGKSEIAADVSVIPGAGQRQTSILARYPEGEAPTEIRLAVDCRAITVRFDGDGYVQSGRDCALVMDASGTTKIQYGGDYVSDSGDPTLSELIVDVQPAAARRETEEVEDMDVELVSVGEARFVCVQDHSAAAEADRLRIELDGAEVEPVAIGCDGEEIAIRLPDGMDLPVSVRRVRMENGQAN